MDWSQDIITDLPPPSELEPPTLRERIVAEISDHLQCAYQREIHLTQNEKQALSNIYKKFGNPAALARKLWFDEMKGRLMLQKITLGLITALCLAVGFLFYFVNRQMELQATANQKFYQEQQTQLFNSINELKSSEPKHEPLIVRLKGVPEDPKNPPLFSVSLNMGKDLILKRQIPLGGEYDYGPINFSKCTLTIEGPKSEIVEEDFFAGPGRDQLFEYDCIKYNPSEKQVNIKFGTAIKKLYEYANEDMKLSTDPKINEINLAFVIQYSTNQPQQDYLIGKNSRSNRYKAKYSTMIVTSGDDNFVRKVLAGSDIRVLYFSICSLPKTFLSQDTDNQLIDKLHTFLDGSSEYFNSDYVKVSEIPKYWVLNPKLDPGVVMSSMERLTFLLKSYDKITPEEGLNNLKSMLVRLQSYRVSQEENQTFVIEAPLEFQQLVMDELEDKNQTDKGQ